MSACKLNKRTLKKRIRKVMWICIFITILLFGGTVIWMEAERSRGESRFWSQCFSSWLADEMNSEYFKQQMGIGDLKYFDQQSPQAKLWLASLCRKWGDPQKTELTPGNMHNIHGVHPKSTNDLHGTVLIEVILNEKCVFRNYIAEEYYYNRLKQWSKGGFGSDLQAWFYNYFTAESISDLTDVHGRKIGTVKTQISPDLTMGLFAFMVTIIVFLGFVSLIIANFIARFLTYPIISPIKRLEETFRAMATGDQEGYSRVYITLKKPLKEIEELIDSTNMIVDKMSEYSDVLSAQRDELEAQNEELEAQNEALVDSHRRIQETQTQLIQSEQMASVGQLTAAIAHEINTPLGAIHSNVQMFTMILEMLKQDERVLSDPELALIAQQLVDANEVSILASQRVTEIIKSLKTFSKLDQSEFQEADINEGIRSVLILTSNLWKRRIAIHEDYAELPLVKCFSGMLNQVFMNLVVNGIHAIGDKGDLHIRTYQEGTWVRISIRDNGCGIKPEHMTRIFEPGFSTKGSGIGMGMGLSICQNIVKKHNGEITVSSEVGHGTEFVVSIPMVSSMNMNSK